MSDRLGALKQSVTLRRCGTCGLFDPQVVGDEGLVTLPCSHRNWQEIEYTPAEQIRAVYPRGGDAMSEQHPADRIAGTVRTIIVEAIHESRLGLREPGEIASTYASVVRKLAAGLFDGNEETP